MHKFLIGTYNTKRLFSFPGDLYERFVLGEERGQVRLNQGVMWMRTSGQMRKTGLTSSVVFLYL